MSDPRPEGSRREARLEASVFALAACALLVLLGLVSMAQSWELAGVSGWIWLVLAVPPVLLVVALAFDAPRTIDLTVILFVVGANLGGLGLLIGSLVTEGSRDLSGGQLLMSGATRWLTNVIVFGLLYWSLDAGGPRARARHGPGGLTSGSRRTTTTASRTPAGTRDSRTTRMWPSPTASRSSNRRHAADATRQGAHGPGRVDLCGVRAPRRGPRGQRPRLVERAAGNPFGCATRESRTRP